MPRKEKKDPEVVRMVTSMLNDVGMTQEAIRKATSDGILEKQLLSRCLKDPAAMNYCKVALIEEDFTMEKHRLMWVAMVELASKGLQVACQSVSAQLATSGKLIKIGGTEAIEILLDGETPEDANHLTLVELLRDKTILRGLAIHWQGCIYQIFTGKRSEEVVTGSVQEYMRIQGKSQSRGRAVSLKDLPAKMASSGEGTILNPSYRQNAIFSPWKTLNRKFRGFIPGEVTVLAGRPASGKSIAAGQIALYAAQEGKRTLYASYEMSPDAVMRRLVSGNCSLRHRDVQDGSLLASETVRAKAFLDEAEKSPLYFSGSGLKRTTDLMLEIYRIKAQYGPIDLLIIDHLQLMKPIKDYRGNKKDEISEITGDLKTIAMTERMAVLALSQLNRSMATRDDKRPQLTDLRDSGSIEQDADQVIAIHRPGQYGKKEQNKDLAEFLMLKNREGEGGIADIKFEADYVRFVDFAQPSLDQDFKEQRAANNIDEDLSRGADMPGLPWQVKPEQAMLGFEGFDMPPTPEESVAAQARWD